MLRPIAAAGLALPAALVMPTSPGRAVTLPGGFSDTLVASTPSPTALVAGAAAHRRAMR